MALSVTTDDNPRARTFGVANPAISAKGASVSDLPEIMEIFRALSPEGKNAALAVARWLVEDRRPETDPRQLDPYWNSFPAAQAVQVR